MKKITISYEDFESNKKYLCLKIITRTASVENNTIKYYIYDVKDSILWDAEFRTEDEALEAIANLYLFNNKENNITCLSFSVN